MKKLPLFAVTASAALLLAAPMFPQGEKQGQGQAIVTVLPKGGGDSSSAPTPTLKLDGKTATVTSFVPLTGAHGGIELVLLIDGSASVSLGRQLNEMANFIQTLPPNTRVGVAYMQNGQAVMSGPLSSDHAAVARQLHLPNGVPGGNASPYFCLSDLAKHWPSQSTATRREVVMITDGVDNYNRRYDPNDPYVQAAMQDSIRAGLVLYSIYWKDQGRADQSIYANDTGQNLLVQVTEATGGKSFWEGFGNPVSFEPYFEELSRRLRNQYELSFTIPFNGKPQVESMKLKLTAPGTEVNSPQQVFVVGSTVAQN